MFFSFFVFRTACDSKKKSEKQEMIKLCFGEKSSYDPSVALLVLIHQFLHTYLMTCFETESPRIRCVEQEDFGETLLFHYNGEIES